MYTDVIIINYSTLWMYARPSHINLCHNWGQWTEAPHPAARCFAPGSRLQEPNIRVPKPLQPKNDGLGTMKFQTINNFNVVNLKNMFGTWMSRFFQNSWKKWFPRHGAQCLIEGIATEHVPFSSMIYLWTIFPQQTVKWPDGRCFFIFSGSKHCWCCWHTLWILVVWHKAHLQPGTSHLSRAAGNLGIQSETFSVCCSKLGTRKKP